MEPSDANGATEGFFSLKFLLFASDESPEAVRILARLRKNRPRGSRTAQVRPNPFR